MDVGGTAAAGQVAQLINLMSTTSPTFRADASGSPVDENFAIVGSGTAVNDILAIVDCTFARAVLFHFPTRGASYQVVVSGSFDGSNWRNLTTHSLTNAASPINGSFVVDSTLRAVETQGFPALRFQIASAGTSGPITLACRRISDNLPWITTAIKPTIFRILPTTVLTAPFGNSTRSGYVKGFRIRNISATDLWFHIAVYNNSTTPFLPANIIDSQFIKAGESFAVEYPGAGIPSGAGFSFAATTDAAGSAYTATGNLVGSIVQGA